MKYEHLFSEDPIGAFEKIKEDYLRYFAHGYKINDKDLNKERVEELKRKDNAYKEPYLEILPEYEAAKGLQSIDDLGDIFADAFGDPESSRSFFSKFIKHGLMNYVPYGHQVGMLEKAFREKKNVVITSGTGSGKTESFLLPLFAELYKEAKSWAAPIYEKSNWFTGTNYTPCQREGENRTAAVRALVLYPMNALVEDQMARLRTALDSDEVRSFFDSEDGLKGNRIYFGRYTGNTMASKNFQLIKQHAEERVFKNAKQKVAQELEKLHNKFQNIRSYYDRLSDEEKKEKSDCLFVSSRLDENVRTAEMVTRWDMQVTPPDILITNTSMLSIMLMRESEKEIWEQTRQWLEEDQSHVFHLVIDELHLYRGTAGSEVSCLLKMLLMVLGLPPVIEREGRKIPNPQLRILASSASLGDAESTQKFLTEFFGVYQDGEGEPFAIQGGSNYRPVPQCDTLDFSEFKFFTPSFVQQPDDEKLAQANEFARRLGCDSVCNFVRKYETRIFSDFINILDKNEADGSLRPIAYTDLFQREHALFNGEEALRGFLIFRGFVDHLLDENGKKLSHKLPRFRFHQFFKYIEGLWGELHAPTHDDPRPVCNLSYVANEVGPNNHKVLELLRCECCGELYIGGDRKSDGTGSYMTLNYPDLDKIPNFNPTPMVQNKSYSEYTLFLPEKHSLNQKEMLPLENEESHVARLDSGTTEFTNTHAQAQWIKSFLNIESGKVQKIAEGRPQDFDQGKWIEGYSFEITQYGRQEYDGSKIQAMPCCCPKCRQNYAKRIYAKSPIRNFRTGIDRMNQILSKELIYQLSEKSNKLIGFSDSRDDAAKQAYGIELEQYRDMVRILFIECVKDLNNGVSEVETFVNEEIRNNQRAIFALPRKTREHFPNIPNAEDIALCILGEEDLSRFKTPFVDLLSLVGGNNVLDGTLVKKLVKLGINPAGVGYEKQFYDLRNNRHWSEAFDFDTGEIQTDIDATYINAVKESLISAIYSNSFGKYMGVSVQDAGIGYICCQRNDTISNSQEYRTLEGVLRPTNVNVYDFVDAYIRILGDNYRYEDPSFDRNMREFGNFAESPSALKKPILRFAEIYSLDNSNLGKALYDFLNKFVSGNATKLIFNKLAFALVDGKDEYYECPKCHRIHLNRGFGFCTNTNCMQQFDETVIKGRVSQLWEHYISHDILVEPKAPRRLHTEELTGQTDNIQDRLLEFKDLILLEPNQDGYRKGYERSKSIDMVNVTTTMEVGVDIGSLQAVFQGNMSPTRYNYQQRVGRGGRRGQAFSLAMTFCRGRSHDVYYYYKATSEMVGAVPVAPTLSLAPYKDKNENGEPVYRMKQAIMKRVLVKTLFRFALESSAFDYDLIDNAGDFGRVSDWENVRRNQIEKWIKEHPDSIREFIAFYFDQFNREGIDISKDIKDLFDWINNDLLSEIDQIVQKCPSPTEGLAQYMSECGYLPMYGLPSDIREFYHGYVDRLNIIKSISRQTEMSISDFAPGSEKTKDKGKYRVEGLTMPLRYSERAGGLTVLGGSDSLYNRYVMSFNGNGRDITISDIKNANRMQQANETANGLEANERLLVIPNAYRSYRIMGNIGNAIDNNERRSKFTQCSIFAKDNEGDNFNKKSVGNVQISAYGVGLQDDALVWHVNTNNGDFFTGKYGQRELRREHEDEDLSKSNFMFYDHRGRTFAANDDGTFPIALGSKKSTEMIKLELLNCNDCIDLSLNTGNSAAIRAGFYSAAFLIQRVLADQLDVQPDEIEISEKLDGKYPIIYMNDALPNGAGLVSYLYENDNLKNLLLSIVHFETGFMKSLLADDHKDCLTACQKCLKTYNNRGFHHVLDWRLGVGIINLMLDKNYDFGLQTPQNHEYLELADNKRIWEVAKQKISGSFDYSDEDGCLVKETRRLGVYKDAIVIYNPLWKRSAILDKMHCSEKGFRYIKMYNTFKLLRSDLTADITITGDDIGPVQTAQDNNPRNLDAAGEINPNNTLHPHEDDFGIIPNQDL